MKSYKNKKADLSLSINSIVILILAITMLGLGLTFIRGMFSRVGGNFEEQASKEPEPSPATDSNPISLSREEVIAGKGEYQVLKINVYCKKTKTIYSADDLLLPHDVDTTVDMLDGCADTVDSRAGTTVKLSIKCNPDGLDPINQFTIPPDYGIIKYLTSETSKAQIKTGTTAGSKICTITAENNLLEDGAEHRAQFTLTIK